MQYNANRALELLRVGSGIPTAQFREGQEEAIQHLVEGRGRLLVVQKTGWGKSFVYFIATRLLREAGHGPAILVSPLLSLMRNQIQAAEKMGLRAATINSDNHDEWDLIEAQLSRNEIDILLISPERFANEHFRTNVLTSMARHVSMFIVDEAHCISDWGHDFRPDYRLIERIITRFPPNLRLLATTATANQRVMDDLVKVLGPNIKVVQGDLNRRSLTLQTITMPSQAERMAWIAQQLPNMPGSGIIYALTIRSAQRLTAWLKSKGINAETYTGQSGNREELEQALLDNQLKVLVATTALGMGFDKPDLAFVIHYQMPGSVVAYYQQVGRAGRALDSAYGVLLNGSEDEDILSWFISAAFPTREEVALVLNALEQSRYDLSVPQLMSVINISQDRVNKTLKALSLESPAPVVKVGTKWRLMATELSNEFWARADHVTALREAELEQMREYVALPFGKHMRFLVGAFDGDTSLVTSPRLPELPSDVDSDLIIEAVQFLKRSSLDIEPRKRWPAGGLSTYNVRGNIPANLQAEIGKTLCVWGDAGWGDLVKAGKYEAGHFSDELVDACTELLESWRPQPAPQWVTCIPSLRHPHLVPSFAKRLAHKLGLPFVPMLQKADERPVQKSMQNSIQQAQNIDGAFVLSNNQPMPQGPVLLVDDMVDSRWTLTVAAWLLRSHGSAEVWPLALAYAGE